MPVQTNHKILRQSSLPALLILAIAVLSCGLSQQAFAQDKAKKAESPLIGSWKWMHVDGDTRVRCELQVSEKDGKVVGTYTDQAKTEAEVTELKCDDGKVQVTLVLDDKSKVQLNGKLKNEKIAGKMKWKDDESDWKAVRFYSLTDAAATWELEFTTPDGVTRKPEIMLSEKDGEPKVEFGSGDDSEASDGEITNVKFEDGVLTFDVALDFNGQELKLEYDLEIIGSDELEGTMYFEMGEGGPSGDVEVIGKRSK